MFWKKTPPRRERDRALDALHERLALMSARLDTLEKAYKEIDLEWSSWYEKFSTLYRRLAKREQRARPADETDGEPAEKPINPLAAQILQGSPLLRRGD